MNEGSNLIYFDHEKLLVNQISLEFIEWIQPILSKLDYRSDIRNQLERASNSILLNIAEGNGKYTSKDRCRYFDISKGSVLESSSCIDIIFIKKNIDQDEKTFGKQKLKEIFSMLIGLIRSNSDRVYEEIENYNKTS
ncbi:MAG: four helix bundle protein [Ignavibacteriales bacterium]|nr:MAG: four helix bundle protein [Ignavibacteriales bacterium]